MAKTKPTPRRQAAAIRLRKKNFLIVLEKYLGIVTKACNEFGIHKDTFYDWCRKDAKFQQEVDKMEDVVLDFGESSLFKQVAAGDSSSTKFLLGCRGRKRGYVNRQDITSGGKPIEAPVLIKIDM